MCSIRQSCNERCALTRDDAAQETRRKKRDATGCQPGALRCVEHAAARGLGNVSVSVFFGQNFSNPRPLIHKVRGRDFRTGDLAGICCGSISANTYRHGVDVAAAWGECHTGDGP
jgi:hypothetical protein